MMEYFIIGVIFVIIIPTALLIDSKRLKIFLCILSFVGYIVCMYYGDTNIPAIEVYRGNTELEITYKNNIPIDTVVVWNHK